MRSTITTIISLVVWVLLASLSFIIMQVSIILGIFAFLAFTIVILFGYIMLDDVMVDLDRAEAREKHRQKEENLWRSCYTYGENVLRQNTGREQINVILKFPESKKEDHKKKRKFPSLKELLSNIIPAKKEKSKNFEDGPISQKEYKGRNINKQTLD
jgi:hypothetical protein